MTDAADKPPAGMAPPRPGGEDPEEAAEGGQAAEEQSAGETTPEEQAGPMSREAARDRAKELQMQHRRRERLRRWGLGLGVAALVIGSGATVAAVLMSWPTAPPAGPLNMPGDAVRITQDGTVRGPGVPGGDGVVAHPVPESSSDGVLDIRIYVDFLSADSGAFLRQDGEAIRAWIEAGSATLEIHPVAMLTTQSAGTQYSLRAANALGCVVNYAPEAALDYTFALVEDQPTEGSEGLSDEELIALADGLFDVVVPVPDSEPPAAPTPATTASPTADAAATQPPRPTLSASVMPRIESCIEEQRFRPWVIAATERAVKGPLPATALSSIVETPTILVEGRVFRFDPLSDANDFRQFVLQVAGEEPVEPTPDPTATAAGGGFAG